MLHKRITALLILGPGLLALAAEPTEQPATFTSTQAQAGQVAYESTCGKCHTPSLLGRKGDPGEIPALTTLPDNYQATVKTMGGKVPPLTGTAFLNRWGSRPAAALIARIREAITPFPPEGVNDENAINIAAYVLQVSGAKAGSQPLTKDSAVVVNTMTR